MGWIFNFILAMTWSTVALANPTPVYLFGGGVREPVALKKYVAEVRNPKILVITWPTAQPEETWAAIEADLIAAGAQNIEHAVHVKSSLTRTFFLEQLAQATHVFISGGDQNLALDLIATHNLQPEFLRAQKRGVIFAGTSAGTAMMSDIAITGQGDFHTIGKNNTQTRPGLGLITQLVDQHYLMRSRHNRLISLLLDHPQRTAIGVDENSAVRVLGENIQAFGVSPAVILRAGDCAGALSLTLLPAP